MSRVLCSEKPRWSLTSTAIETVRRVWRRRSREPESIGMLTSDDREPSSLWLPFEWKVTRFGRPQPFFTKWAPGWIGVRMGDQRGPTPLYRRRAHAAQRHAQ